MSGKSQNQNPPKGKTFPQDRSAQSSQEHESVRPDQAPTPFRVVAIGASAGGLEAVTELLDALRPDTNMAFILVQHQSIQGQHLLPTLLARHTRMPVLEAENGMPVEPNHFYINPPDSGLVLEHDTLKTYLRPTEREHPNYIDVLFESVAREKQALAVGVLLSGLDSDGVNGIRTIQQAGGITFVQDRTAQFYQLPANAIAKVAIDFVLPAKEIANELALLADLPILVNDQEVIKQPDFDAAYLTRVLEAVSRGTKMDFTHYKTKTIQRRLWRRMLLTQITDLNAYLAHLQQTPQEAQELAHDFLINVTSFFREPDMFQLLKDNVFPELIKQAQNRPLRIWVPACATGEEAYSIAMTYLEFLQDMATNPRLQIFATDLSETAVNLARRGVYPEADLEGVSVERRKRFFTKVDGGYQISQPVRNLCIFAVQNVLYDPPISHVDLISCNNLFIYLKEEGQRQAVKTFHFALNPNGYLMMGSAESIGFATHLFSLADSKQKIYRKRPSTVELSTFLSVWEQRKTEFPQQLKVAAEPLTLFDQARREADHLILSQFAPAGFMVNGDLDILQFRGDTGPFLQPANERPSLHLSRMVRPELQPLIHEAVSLAKNGAPVRKEGIRLMLNGSLKHYDVSVIPLHSGRAEGENYFLILFASTASAPRLKNPDTNERSETEGTAGDPQLTRDLATCHQYVQELKEEHDAAGEELRAAIEESQSNNEELQSTVEELESTKEELQSNYEELSTVNEELCAKNNDLMRANDDLSNLLASINLAFIILDEHGRIRRFSNKATETFSLIESDIGRPLSDIKPKLDIPPLEPLIEEAMKRLDSQSLVIRDQQGKECQMKIRPYKTADNRIEGVVVVVQDKS